MNNLFYPFHMCKVKNKQQRKSNATNIINLINTVNKQNPTDGANNTFCCEPRHLWILRRGGWRIWGCNYKERIILFTDQTPNSTEFRIVSFVYLLIGFIIFVSLFCLYIYIYIQFLYEGLAFIVKKKKETLDCVCDE